MAIIRTAVAVTHNRRTRTIDIVDDILQDLWSWRLKYLDCTIIIGGDLNTDLEKRTDVSSYIDNFLTDHSLHICDTKCSSRRQHTYVNESLGQFSIIDYFLCDADDVILDYCVSVSYTHLTLPTIYSV